MSYSNAPLSHRIGADSFVTGTATQLNQFEYLSLCQRLDAIGLHLTTSLRDGIGSVSWEGYLNPYKRVDYTVDYLACFQHLFGREPAEF